MTENDGEIVGLLQYYIFLNDNQSFPPEIDQNIEGVLMYTGEWNIWISLYWLIFHNIYEWVINCKACFCRDLHYCITFCIFVKVSES